MGGPWEGKSASWDERYLHRGMGAATLFEGADEAGEAVAVHIVRDGRRWDGLMDRRRG